jgi:hypothetical protein
LAFGLGNFAWLHCPALLGRVAFAPVAAMTQQELFTLPLAKRRKVKATEREAQAWFALLKRKLQGSK